MKALEFTGTLHTVDQDGRAMLVADFASVQVRVDPRSGNVAVNYPGRMVFASGRDAFLSVDVARRFVCVTLRPTPRLKGLRRQAMRKGRSGWRSIR
jgi:hypothetical protein